jgi:cyclic pyranopterin phosphate synthase
MFIDPFGRRISYLRLSVTDRCNLRCTYCMPPQFKDFEEPENWLTFDEIEQIVRVFSSAGTHRIRITGGEPLLRRNLVSLTQRLSKLPGVEDLSLSTNATRLAKAAAELKMAGVKRINVSLDTINPKQFKQLTGGKISKVLDGLRAAKSAGFDSIKINAVALNSINNHEVDELLEYCILNRFVLRFIETMPIGSPGQEAINQYVDLQVLRARLEKRFDLIPELLPGGGPARYFRARGTDTVIGFITPLSQHFCDTCNRVRLSVDGTLYLCLGHEHSYPLREIVRNGVTDEQLYAHPLEALKLKPEKHEFKENPGQIVRFMSMTGG